MSMVNLYTVSALMVYRSNTNRLTAYALSAGGPLICPEIDAIVCVPLNPHTLSSRPIVLHGDSEIEIRVNSRTASLGYLRWTG